MVAPICAAYSNSCAGVSLEENIISSPFTPIASLNINSVKEPKSFKVANDAIGLMEQKLGNIGSQMGTVSEKIAKVEAQYEKLGKEKGFDDDEVIKLENELTSLQAKLISLQSTANATEDKLNKALSGPAQKAQQAYQKAYDDIVNRAANASKQAEQWALKAERAHSKSASRAAKHAVAAYNKQAKAARTYANKYADAQSDANDKSIKAVERAYKKMESTAKKAANASSNAMHKMAKDSSKSTYGMGRAFHKLGKTIKGSLKAVFVTAVLYKFFKARYINKNSLNNKKETYQNRYSSNKLDINFLNKFDETQKEDLYLGIVEVVNFSEIESNLSEEELDIINSKISEKIINYLEKDEQVYKNDKDEYIIVIFAKDEKQAKHKFMYIANTLNQISYESYSPEVVIGVSNCNISNSFNTYEAQKIARNALDLTSKQEKVVIK